VIHVPQNRNSKRKRPTGTLSPLGVRGPFGGWRVVDRTQEAIERGVAYILTGQHLGPARRVRQAGRQAL